MMGMFVVTHTTIKFWRPLLSWAGVSGVLHHLGWSLRCADIRVSGPG
jgi:hypothetical protein